MTNLAISNQLESTLVVNRLKAFVQHYGFSKAQPVGWVKGNVFDLTAILCSVKNNYPFGYCPSNKRYVCNVEWNWSKLPKDLPITKLAFSLVLGVECFSACVLQNVGRKKIKLNDKWSHRLCKTGVWYEELTSTVDLTNFTDEEILQSIQIAQQIINDICTVEFSDVATQFEEDRSFKGNKYEARRILSSLYMLDITTEMPMSINDRIEFVKLPKPYAYKTQLYCESEYSEYFSKLLNRLTVKAVADLMLDLIPYQNDTGLILAVLDNVNNEQLSKELFQSLHAVIIHHIDDYEQLVLNYGKPSSSPEDVLAMNRKMPTPVLTNYLNRVS
ncbi:hypothetical protein ACQWTT_001350 [Acinetobacter baumannii]